MTAPWTLATSLVTDDAPTDPGIGFGDLARTTLKEILLGNNIIPESGPWPATTWTFLGIAATFLLTRGITRFIRRRSADGAVASGPVKDIIIGGVHIHHQVFGIVLMALSGVALVAISPSGVGLGVLAGVLGVGIGLAFDEFALWLHLDDVYWREQGRKSIDAVAIMLVVVGEITVVVGVVHDITNGPDEAVVGQAIIWIEVLFVALTFVPAVICLLKGKPVTAGFGVVYIPFGLVGMVRLAKPGSWWARHRYPLDGRRVRRSARRFDEQYQARWNKVRDLVGGAPTAPE